jgi:hypothetical protein
MSFTAWAGTFVDSQTTISADFLNNYVKPLTSYAVDGRGGDYTPTAKLRIGGTFGLEINGTGSAVRVRLAGHSVTRMQDDLTGFSLAAGWEITTAGVWINSGGAGSTVDLKLHLPDGATLTGVTVYVNPAAGHGGLPTLPGFTVYRRDDTDTETSLGTGTDTSGSVVIYEAAHGIASGAISHTVDKARNRYYLRFTGESGGNFVANGTIYNISCTYAANNHDED